MKIRIISDSETTATLQREFRRLQDTRPLMEAVGKAVANMMRSHFLKRNAGGTFWGEVTAATELTSVTASKATVTVADYRFLHKLHGGTIVPKRRKWLTIPLISKAKALAGKGTIERSAPFLKLLFRRPGGKLKLFMGTEKRKPDKVKEDGTKVKGELVSATFWFVLKKAVTHAPDPDALPPRRVFRQTINAAVRQVMPLLLEGKA